MQRTLRAKPPNPALINKETQALALEILGSENFLVINKKVLAHYGPEVAVYIGNLVDKYKYFQEKGKLGPDSSFFLTHADQSEQTGMSEYQLRKCKAKLKEIGVLTTELRGVPPKEFYILDMEKLVESLVGLTLKKLKGCPYENLMNNKDTKYKDNKNNNISQNPKNETKTNQGQLTMGIDAGTGKSNSSHTHTEEVVELYHKYCPSLPRVIKLTSKRKKTTQARLKEYPMHKIQQAFQKSQASDFLSGRNGKWSGCNFDWLMNENNLVKVLEGNYDNNGSAPSTSTPAPVASPQRPLKKHFPEKILRKAFINECYEPAKQLLGLNGEPSPPLIDALLNLHSQIEQEQKNHLPPAIQLLAPGSITLIKNYLAWVEEQSWVTEPKMNMLNISHGLFTKFRREQAKEDNQERDPLTGRSYLRG